MKRNILHTLWAAALLLTGCTQEELPLPGADNAAPLAITITDGGYALTTSADGSQKARYPCYRGRLPYRVYRQ